MTSDAVRWTKKYNKYSSTMIRRKKQQIFDDDSPTTATPVTISSSTSSLPSSAVERQSINTVTLLEHPVRVTRKSQDLNEILVNFSNGIDYTTSSTGNTDTATRLTATKVIATSEKYSSLQSSLSSLSLSSSPSTTTTLLSIPSATTTTFFDKNFENKFILNTANNNCSNKNQFYYNSRDNNLKYNDVIDNFDKLLYQNRFMNISKSFDKYSSSLSSLSDNNKSGSYINCITNTIKNDKNINKNFRNCCNDDISSTTTSNNFCNENEDDDNVDANNTDNNNNNTIKSSLNINNNRIRINNQKYSKLFSEILVIIMSTLFNNNNNRCKLRTFFNVLPIIIVILQVNFIFSYIKIMNVVASESINNNYNINNNNGNDNNNLLWNNEINFLNNTTSINNNKNNNYNSKIPSDYVQMNDVYSLTNNNNNSHYDQEGIGHYTSTWAVHIPNGDSGLADDVAKEHGFINLGKIFDDHYHFEHYKISKRSIEPSHHHQIRLSGDERVRWSKQQRIKSRKKRDFIRMRPSRTSSSRTLSVIDSIQLSDPKWSQMWYLNRGGGLDMNVIPAWKEGITGKGVVVTILDDGLESDHPDLEHNYDPKASYDVNSHDDDPMPHYDMTDSNRHGTRCAGEVAATANNSLCAVGIAFGARVGGVRMLDGDVTDAVEARSLSLNPQHIDIYSASWGPDDDGKTVDGPGELASRAFIEGVTKGRNGKGSIFIWASGNGGRELDNCNCDGYTNSIWTLSISSATEDGHVPWYSEKCSSTLATTYSSGGQSEKQVVTTDLHHSCTISHTGTSASAPLAAGIVALVLEANRNLTWRDLQHIVVRTAKPGNLKDPTWSKNGVGRRVSHSFGYGLMDAAAMVKVARTWRTVPEQQRCEINAPHVDKKIPAKSYITLQLTVRHCMGVNFLEHVQAKITLTSQRRGDIQIYLKSPAGTKVTLLTSRMHDVSRTGFNQWPFMSVHTWGEAPHGNWQLEIHNEGRYMAQITQWDLIFYGTEKPAQPNDPIRISPGQYGAYGGELEHNLLDFDSQTASGQWRNMQQVGESHVDVQRTTSNDQTNSACLDYSPDQRCIECHQTTFIYEGHCYARCPNGTYMVPEVPENYPKTYLVEPLMMTSNDRIDTYYDGNNIDRTDTDRTGGNEHVAILDADTVHSPSNSGAYNYYSIFGEKRAIMRPMLQKRCAACDPSCLQCNGPNAGDCTICPAGYQLRKIPSSGTYCYYLAERSSGNNGQNEIFGEKLNRIDGYDDGDDDSSMRNDLYMFLMIIIPAISMIFLIVVITIFGRKLFWSCERTDDNNYSYDRVAFNIDEEGDDEYDYDYHENAENP